MNSRVYKLLYMRDLLIYYLKGIHISKILFNSSQIGVNTSKIPAVKISDTKSSTFQSYYRYQCLRYLRHMIMFLVSGAAHLRSSACRPGAVGSAPPYHPHISSPCRGARSRSAALPLSQGSPHCSISSNR